MGGGTQKGDSRQSEKMPLLWSWFRLRQVPLSGNVP